VIRWSSAAKVPSLIRRRSVGWPTRRQTNGEWLSILAVREQPQLLELVGAEQVRLVEHHRGVAASFVFLGGEQAHRLGDQRRLVEAPDTSQSGDDAPVETTSTHGRVPEVDHRVAAGIQAGQRCPHGHRLARADLAGDHPRPRSLMHQ